MGLRGGGKRGRASASTKDPQGFLGIPQRFPTDPPVVTTALSLEYININRWLDELPLPQLEKLYNELEATSSTGNMDHIARISCHFSAEVMAIEDRTLKVQKSEL